MWTGSRLQMNNLAGEVTTWNELSLPLWCAPEKDAYRPSACLVVTSVPVQNFSWLFYQWTCLNHSKESLSVIHDTANTGNSPDTNNTRTYLHKNENHELCRRLPLPLAYPERREGLWGKNRSNFCTRCYVIFYLNFTGASTVHYHCHHHHHHHRHGRSTIA